MVYCMFKFDWKSIYAASEGRAVEVIRIVRMLVYKQISKNRYDSIYKYRRMNFSGLSFLKHPEILLYNTYKHSYKDMAEYIGLASFRSYGQYLAEGTLTLDLRHAPADLDLINSNPLLRIENGLIHFLYEEGTMEI